MIHDLDLLLSLIGRPVSAIESTGISVFGAHEDIAQARLHFAGGCVAEVALRERRRRAQRECCAEDDGGE
jgi:predicted dehydrogenase